MAVLDVKDLIEEASHMEAKAIFLQLGKRFSIFVLEDPAALREGELQLVAVVSGLIRSDDRGDFRYFKVTYAHELVIDLLLLCLKLHFIRQRLPFTSAADAEMLAERLQTVL